MYSNKGKRRPKARSKESRFFKNYIDRMGKNFLDLISQPQEINRLKSDMHRMLIRELAFGNVNLNAYGSYFTPQFNLWLLEVAEKEFVKRRTIMAAMTDYYMSGKDPNSALLYTECRESYSVYCKIYNALYNLNLTGDLRYLQLLPSEMKNSYPKLI